MPLVAQADILLEGFRLGVAERLGIGPDDCLILNVVGCCGQGIDYRSAKRGRLPPLML